MAQQQTVPPETKAQVLKIVLIGATKAGKSATGNTILGRKAFKSLISNSSVTQECKLENIELDGQNLAVVDTPCLFGSTASDSLDEEIQEQVLEELKQLLLDPPGPVVYLVVLQLGRFTEQEQQIVEMIQRSFGREAVHYTMALFTRGDDLKKEGRSIEELIGKNLALRDFIRECRGGCHVFDNGDAHELPQVTELLQKINSIVERNGGSNNGMSQEDEGVLQREKLGRKARKATGRGNAFGMFLVEGAFDGVCRYLLVSLLNRRPGYVILKAVKVGGLIGACAGAVRYVVRTRILGN